jgi:hypothetical protein
VAEREVCSGASQDALRGWSALVLHKIEVVSSRIIYERRTNPLGPRGDLLVTGASTTLYKESNQN